MVGTVSGFSKYGYAINDISVSSGSGGITSIKGVSTATGKDHHYAGIGNSTFRTTGPIGYIYGASSSGDGIYSSAFYGSSIGNLSPASAPATAAASTTATSTPSMASGILPAPRPGPRRITASTTRILTPIPASMGREQSGTLRAPRRAMAAASAIRRSIPAPASDTSPALRPPFTAAAASINPTSVPTRQSPASERSAPSSAPRSELTGTASREATSGPVAGSRASMAAL